MAVIRIETAPIDTRLNPNQREKVVEAITDTLRITQADAVQVDFDARVSERPFYIALLRELREQLGPVSWCGANSWIDELPVDEVVPMTFEMGAVAASAETMFRSGGQSENPRCTDSIGISTHQLDARPRKYRRTYVFSNDDWTGAKARGVLAKQR